MKLDTTEETDHNVNDMFTSALSDFEQSTMFSTEDECLTMNKRTYETYVLNEEVRYGNLFK